MKPQEIEDRPLTFTNRKTGETLPGHIHLYHTPNHPDQWRFVFNRGVIQEDLILPYEAHEHVRVIDGSLFLEF